MNKARLFCETGFFAGKEFEIGSETLIGRSQTSSVTLSSEAISNHHARIFYDSDSERFVLEDLGSRNGTRLDGMRVRAPEPLDSLNVITFADEHDFIFQTQTSGHKAAAVKPPALKAVVEEKTMKEKTMVEDMLLAPPPVANSATTNATANATVIDEGSLGPPPAAPAAPAAPMPPAENAEERTIMEADIAAPPAPVDALPVEDETQVSPEPASHTSFSLHIIRTGASFVLAEGDQTLGRKGPCEIVIVDSSVSRKHARIHISKGVVTITDLGSKNGVTVNGARILAPVTITTKDSIRIGEVDVELQQ